VSGLNSDTLRWLNSLLNTLIFGGWALYLIARRREPVAHIQTFETSSAV
jgi:hypothetical protein